MAQALYRRYRPETFADVIGQEHVTEPLMRALDTGRVGHAYLFSGPRGCGKTTSARILARCLNCAKGPTSTPCGVCESCVALARGGAGTVDVIEIDAASHGGVDDARDLRERASFGPAQSRYKIYIIDEAHMVTPQGFNALLKIVEEPPEHVKFVFATTEPDKVIGTIRSRTHHYPFRLVPPQRLSDYMQTLCDAEGVQVEPGVLGFVTRAGGGSVRDSLSVLDQLIAGSGDNGLTYADAASLLGFTDGELLDAILDALAASDSAGVFRQIDRVVESGHDPRRFVEDLLERLRDLIIVAAVPDGAGQVLRDVPGDQLDRMQTQAAAFGPGALTRAAAIVNAGLTEMTGATSPRLQLELMLARVLLPTADGSDGYAARLDRIERRLSAGAPAGPVAVEAEPGNSGAPSRPASTSSAPASAPDSTPSDEGSGEGGDEGEWPTVDQVSSRSVSSEDPSPGAQASRSSQPVDPAHPAEPERAAAPVQSVESASGAASGAGPGESAGALGTEELRRSWPALVQRISQLRRVTWTLVSQHAHVINFDGRVLTLGISTPGIAQAFSAGNHIDVVRQALHDELGIDAQVRAQVDGGAGAPDHSSGPAGEPSQGPIHEPPAAQPDRSAAHDRPADGGGARQVGGHQAGTGQAGTDQGRPASDGGSGGSGDGHGSGGDRHTSAGIADERPHWGSTTSSAPGWASDDAGWGSELDGEPRGGSDQGDGTDQGGGTGGDRPPARNMAGGLDASDIDSLDDEDVADAGDVGIPVVQAVLGATIIEDTRE